ncbi:hypothetical protein ABK040_003900 [Willaertia magna]
MSTTNTIISVNVCGIEFIFDELILDNIFNYLNIIDFLNLCIVNSEINNYIKKSQRLKQFEENKIKLKEILNIFSSKREEMISNFKDIDIGYYFTKAFQIETEFYKSFPQEWKLNSEITLNYIKSYKYKHVFISDYYRYKYFEENYFPNIHFNDYNIMKYLVSLNYRRLQYASDELKENSNLFELACCSILNCDMDNISNIREYYLLRKILLKDNSLYKIFPKSLFKNVKLIIFGMKINKYCKVFYDLFKEQNLNMDLLFKEITKKDIFWFKSELFKVEEFVLNILKHSKLDNHWPFMLIKHYNNYISKFSKETLLQIVKLVPHSIKLFYSEFTKEELKELSLHCNYILKQYLK